MMADKHIGEGPFLLICTKDNGDREIYHSSTEAARDRNYDFAKKNRKDFISVKKN